MNKIESLAQDLLSAGNEHFQMALHPDRVLFWVTGPTGDCELLSPEWTELTGQPFEQARDAGWLQKVAPDDRQRVTDVLHESIASQRGFFLHYQLMHRDGDTRRVLHDAAVRTLPSGKFNGLIATLTDETHQASDEATIIKSAQQVYQFLDNVPLASLAIDFNGRVVHANPAFCQQAGYPRDQLIGTDWIGSKVTPEDRARVRPLIDGSITPSAMPANIEFQIDTPSGTRLYRWHLTLIRDSVGQPAHIVMMGTDISQWRRFDDHLRLTAQMFEGSKEAMVISDRGNRIISVNPSFTRLTGYTREEAAGRNPSILSSGKHDKAFYRQMWESIQTLGYWRGDIWDRRKDGSLYPKFLAISAIRDDIDQIVNYTAIFYDISERKALEDELDHLAHHDNLTGLPNRMLLQDRLEQAISAAERHAQHFALLFIDLDGFKPVNDQYGHEAGDVLLKEVGQRLLAIVRGMDTAARLGGDEFVVILTDIRSRDNAAQVADKILASLCEPYQLDDYTDAPVSVSASIGVSVFPNDELVAHELLRSADAAMFQAKREGKRRVIFHGNVG